MEIDHQLKGLWLRILGCDKCRLPKGFYPQFRPIGRNYKAGGIVFVQINPGQIGALNEELIFRRYKTKRGREIARRKAKATSDLLRCQEAFRREQAAHSWEVMCGKYRKAMSETWGWPAGKFRKTIESHGVDIDSVAVVNLAQCPVPNDRYKSCHLETCWARFTKQIIEILAPERIVAQGSQVYGFLRERCGEERKLIRGVHHASRLSKAEKEEVLKAARDLLPLA